MSRLVAGQTLSCGCVVGAYWCRPHDIYAVRSEPTTTWCSLGNGHFGWKTLSRNNHIREIPRSTSRYDDYDDVGGCSCHISPPCSYCTRKTDEDDDEVTS